MKYSLITSYPATHKEGDNKGKVKLDKAGNKVIVFKYRVTGTKDELEEYERIQKENGVDTIKDDLGKHLWFTVYPPATREGQLMISTNGKIYADTTNTDLAKAMIQQHGLFGQMMAKEIMKDSGVDIGSVNVPDDMPDSLENS